MRLFTARMKLGMFDPPEMVPYTKIDEKLLNSAEHRALALKLANESMVLLKNDGVLPLEDHGHQDCRSGPAGRPDARAARQLQRHSDAHGFDPGGIEEGVAGATINYVPGTQFLSKEAGRCLPTC